MAWLHKKSRRDGRGVSDFLLGCFGAYCIGSQGDIFASQCDHFDRDWNGAFALDSANYISQLRDLIVRVSRQLPARTSALPDELHERQYADAGRLFALHEQEIYDAINQLHGLIECDRLHPSPNWER